MGSSLDMSRFLSSSCQHVVKRILAYTLLDASYPFVLFFCCGCRHSINIVFAFYNLPLLVNLAGFNDVLPRGKQLEAEGLVSLLRGNLPDRDILQWNDPLGLLIRCELEVVQTVVVKDEPPPLPILYSSTCNVLVNI